MFDMFNEDNTENTYSNSSSTSTVTSSTTSNYSSASSDAKGFVISAGGSVFIGEKPLVNKIIDFCNAINDLSSEFRFVIVVGGGKTARNYRDAADDLGANNFELDSIGIAATRINAMLFLNKINNSHKKIITSYNEIDEIVNEGRIPIMGGISEGQTTDAVGALVAEKLGFEFINLSNVDGIFDSDPNTNEEAVMFNELSFNDMNYLLNGKLLLPGQHLFVDPQAASIISRSKIKSYFLNGDHLENFKNCLRGYDFKGTVVSEIIDVIDKEKNVESEEEGFTRYEDEENLNSVENDFVENTYQDDEADDDEEIDPRKIDFGR
jgi:uridylate kinase